jgi:TonB family protein
MLSFGVLAPILHAQTAPDKRDASKAFLDSTVKQHLILKGFSADPTVDYQWTTNGLVMQTPIVHTFGIFETDSAKVKHGQIEIAGRRRTLFKTIHGTWAVSSPTSVLLRIDPGGVDSAILLPQLKSELFYASLDDALPSVPKKYKALIPYQDAVSKPPPRKGAKESLDKGNQAKQAMENCAIAPSTYTHPKILYYPEPVYTDQAAKMKFSGKVVVAVTFLDTGRIADPWLAMPAGYGLDEEAVTSLAKFRFEPATCSGSPIPFASVVISHLEMQ